MRSCSRQTAGTSHFPLLLLLKLFALFGTVLCVAATSRAQDKIELFGGYSYFRASIRIGEATPVGPGILCPPTCNTSMTTQHANLNGWELSGQYKLLPFLGAAADFNGNYGTLDGAGTRMHTFLFGPQLSLPTRVSPFVHALFGVAKESQDAIPVACVQVTPICPGPFSLGSDTSFGTAVGAGFDIKLAPLVKLRLIQVDYLRTQLHGATQDQARASAGIVLHF
jgi:hypothetical protein